MATRKTTRRPRKGAKKAAAKFIGIEASRPTEQQIETLREAFHAKAVAVLGLDADGSYTNQSPTARRRPS